MCDACRTHDRLLRKSKKLRDSGRGSPVQNGHKAKQVENVARRATEVDQAENTLTSRPAANGITISPHPSPVVPHLSTDVLTSVIRPDENNVRMISL
jgi:hypothetical protein